jgi:hypothetical protein
MRRLPAGLLLGLLASVAAIPSAGAQSYRSGFWLGAGLGSSRTDFSCDICIDDTKGELSGYLRGGFTLKPNLLLGLEATRTRNEEDGVNERYTGLSAIIMAYPGHGGLYFKGGVGLLDYKASDGTDEFTARTVALTIGTGWEVRVASNFSVVPFVNVTGTTKGDLDFNGSLVTTDANFSLLQVGLGVTMH